MCNDWYHLNTVSNIYICSGTGITKYGGGPACCWSRSLHQDSDAAGRRDHGHGHGYCNVHRGRDGHDINHLLTPQAVDSSDLAFVREQYTWVLPVTISLRLILISFQSGAGNGWNNNLKWQQFEIQNTQHQCARANVSLVCHFSTSHFSVGTCFVINRVPYWISLN